MELIDIWEEVPGMLHKIMNDNGGLAVQRLRDATAQQRLEQLQHDMVERSIKGVLSQTRGVPVNCARCGGCLMSTGEKAPVRAHRSPLPHALACTSLLPLPPVAWIRSTPQREGSMAMHHVLGA